jgi:hypothetical protein
MDYDEFLPIAQRLHADSANSPHVLTFEALPFTNADAALVEAQKFQLAEVCRAFGVPPWLLDSGYEPTPAEREGWRRRIEKAARRARYVRRYQRGRR